MANIRLPWRSNTVSSNSAHLEFVTLAYQLVLQREPDEAGLASYLRRLQANQISPAGVLAEIKASEEYLILRAGFNLYSTKEFLWYISQRNESLELDLRRGAALPGGAFERAWREVFASGRELIVGQEDYAPLHRQRFEELFNGVQRLLGEYESPRLLEFGVSEFSSFYKKLWPGLKLELADRPTGADYPGFNRQRSLALSGAELFHEVDLQQPLSLEPTHSYDVIVIAEVLEHLVVNPVELLRALLGLLAPNGVIYLTTPNFFREENARLFSQLENPQEAFPAGDGNWDAHYHHREYGAREMLASIREAGGLCRSFYFSSCWDTNMTKSGPESAFGNMVFVISAD